MIALSAANMTLMSFSTAWQVGTVFVVAKSNTNFAAIPGLLDSPAGNNAWLVGGGTNTAWYDGGKGSYCRDGVNTLEAAPGTPHVYEFVITTGPYYNETNGMQVGQDGPIDGRDWDGYVGDIISYPVKLSTSDRSLVRSYLGAKYGITVA